MIVHSYSQTLFGRILFDYIIIQFSLDLCRFWQSGSFLSSDRALAFLLYHGFCQIHAFITYINIRSHNDLAHLRVGLAAKRASYLIFVCHFDSFIISVCL